MISTFIPTIWGFGPNAGRIQVTNNLNSDGVRSATMGRDPNGIIFGAVQNTGHTVALGETFDLTFDWLAGPNWDTDDRILYRVFTTSDNTVTGTITEFASGSVSGQAGPQTDLANYNNESFTGLTPAGANIGKQLWIEFWSDTNGGIQEFARLDNVTLSSTVISETSAVSLADFSYDPQTGDSEVRIEGEPNTAYILAEADDLDFGNPDQNPVPLSAAAVGTLSGDQVTTDANGDATVQFNLGTAKPATFIRAENAPPPLSLGQPLEP
jgi:hypothetical protein